MSVRHCYRGLDRTGGLELPSIGMRELAERIEATNYGVHRLLSHLVDVRREALERYIAEYEHRGDYGIARSVRDCGDPLMEGIERLLDAGHF